MIQLIPHPPSLIPLFDGPYSPYLPAFVLLILFGTAAWDARTGIVPNIPLVIGAVAIIAGRYFANGWEDALLYAGFGFGTWAFIWLLNEGWYLLFKKDAVGMGDAKWTALAVTTFGGIPALFAWFAGAWVSIIWIIGCYAVGVKIKKVYFAPFLFCGLMIGLLITRKIITLPFPLMF